MVDCCASTLTEPELAAQLSKVLRVTGARIVLSSDWRIGRELHHLQNVFTEQD